MTLAHLMLIRRRHVILGGTATAVLSAAACGAQAQQRLSAVPTIGVLWYGSRETTAAYLRSLREGLREGGYVEGQNLAAEHRWADRRIDRLPAGWQLSLWQRGKACR